MGPYLVILCQLIFTILIEGSVIIVWKSSKEALGYSVLANLMTNPPLNLLLLFLSMQGIGLYATLGIRLGLEVLVVLAEALAYKGMMRLEFKKALFISLVLNLTSFAIGEIFGVLGYWRVLGVIAGL
ncbi:MAG: hypothetical protein J6Q41_05595 [Firmicutes bacterium]|nr:hypothetical protein [Bacillota bacterium]